MQIKLNAK